MLHKINATVDFLKYCSIAKDKFLLNGLPNPRLETWKMTQLHKYLPQELSFNSNYKGLFLLDKFNRFSKELTKSNIKSFESKYFVNNQMTDCILGNINSTLFLDLPSDTNFEETIYLNTIVENETWSSPIILINVGENTNVDLSIDIKSQTNSLCTPIISLNLSKNSSVSFGINIQNHLNESLKNASFISLIECNLNINSVLNMAVSQQGLNLSRTDLNVCLSGEKSIFNLDGIYFGRYNQHKDITTCVNHLAQSTISKQIIRGILDDKSTGVYQGGIKVSKEAQKTDGQQMSRALLLSELAESNSKPELEIFADDVSCSHGTTIGELNKDQFFYLLSRGISSEKAREILIIAYLNELIDQVKSPLLSNQLDNAVNYWFKQTKINLAA